MKKYLEFSPEVETIDRLDAIMCSHQGRGQRTIREEQEALTAFLSLVLSGAIRVVEHDYIYDHDARTNAVVREIYDRIAPHTRWRTGSHTEIELMRLNALRELSELGEPVYEDGIFYPAAGAWCVCGNITPMSC